MRTTVREAKRDRSVKREGDRSSDGYEETITGGPMRPLDLMELLSPSIGAASRSGAVSGAAQRAGTTPGKTCDRAIELSDGSRIIFATMADFRAFAEA